MLSMAVKITNFGRTQLVDYSSIFIPMHHTTGGHQKNLVFLPTFWTSVCLHMVMCMLITIINYLGCCRFDDWILKFGLKLES